MVRKYFLMCTFLMLALAGCENDDPNQFVATGIVEGAAVKVAAQTGGQILQMPVAEGQPVAMAQTIAVVDTEKLVYQLEGIDASLSELEVQKKMVRNSMETARSNFENAEKKYQRFEKLYEKNSASKQTLDDLKTAYDVAEGQLENAQQNVKLVESKESGLLAQRKLLVRQISDANVTSPISGTLTTRFFEPGETVMPGQPVAEVIDLAKMWTKVYISERLLPHVKVGEAVTVQIDGTERTLPGTVSWVSSEAEFTPKTILTEESRTALVYAVKINIENRDTILKHGMPVEVIMPLAGISSGT